MAQRTVSGATFLWLVLQHVLPKGFRRARNCCAPVAARRWSSSGKKYCRLTFIAMRV